MPALPAARAAATSPPGCISRLYPTGASRKGSGEVEAQNAGPQLAIRNRNRMARPECHILKGAAILAKRDLAPGAAVQIVKHRLAALCDAP